MLLPRIVRFNLIREVTARLEVQTTCVSYPLSKKTYCQCWFPHTKGAFSSLSVHRLLHIRRSIAARNITWNDDIECAVVVLDHSGSMVLAVQSFWQRNSSQSCVTSWNKIWGQNSDLRKIGIMLPLLLALELVSGRYVVSKVDIPACVFGLQISQL